MFQGKPVHPCFQDLTGLRPSKYIYVEEYVGRRSGKALWRCRCSCGRTFVAVGSDVKRGKYKSCGCRRKYNARTHGRSSTSEYHIWSQMKVRCADATDSRYGGRGISVCRRWLDPKSGFENFLTDMGPRPRRMSLDRRDNDGDYCPENCRWATYRAQIHNRSCSIKITHDGESLRVSQWARRYGLTYQTLYHRVFVLGWNIGQALMEPVRGR